MRFLKIEVPDALIQSARANRLVIFVGAGASYESPSDLPGFKVLATAIAQGTKAEPIVIEKDGVKKEEPLDRFLGRVEKDFGVDVYKRTHQELSREESRPNRIHKSIVSLFGPDSPIRIVTTNFDMHLEGALDELELKKPEIYRAPALPIGNDFEGIVYVHGRLEPKPDQIVITDRDFGRAYLTEGWARRFLSQVFATYDVLFVGYSHDDPVVSYLARGLPPASDKKRYALTEAGRSGHWNLLGIDPVEFPNEDGSFSELGDLLANLVEFMGRGASGHEQILKEYLSRELEDIKAEERDYLLFALREEKLRHVFFRHAIKPHWLHWMDSVDQLQPIFDPICDDSELANWFVRNPLDDRGATALRILSKSQRQASSSALQINIARELFHEIGRLANEARDSENTRFPDESVCRIMLWIAILASMQRLDPLAAQFLGYLLEKLPCNDDTQALHLVIFELISRPYPAIRIPFLQTDERKSEVKNNYAIEQHTMNKLWKNVYQPRLELLADGLIPILAGNLMTSRRHLLAAGQAKQRFDLESFGRSAIAIEPDDQNKHRHVIDTLIDAARDSLAFLNKHTPRKARRVIEDWISSESLLLQRIAVHGMKYNASLSPNQVFELIRGTTGLLRDSYAEHEVLHTLRYCYEAAKEPLRRRILKAKRKGFKERYEQEKCPEKDPADLATWELGDWTTFLHWLDKEVGDCKLLKREIQKVTRHRADVEPNTEYPDFNTRSWSGSIEPVSPISKEDLLQLRPEEVLAFAIEVAQRPRQPGINESAGLLGAVGEAAATTFAWSFAFAEFLVAEEMLQSEVWDSLFGAWKEASYSAGQEEALLKFLSSHEPLLTSHQDNVASLLRDRFQSSKAEVSAELHGLAVQLALTLWPLIDKSQRVIFDGGDLFTETLNNPAGHLAQFAVSALSRQKNDFERTLEESPNLHALFDRIANDADDDGECGVVILGMQLPFLQSVALNWTKEKLIPLFDWERNPKVAGAAWTGYLQSKTLLPLEEPLTTFLTQLFRHLDLFDEQIRRQIPKLVIALLNHHEEGLSSDWLTAFLQHSLDSDRALFWQQLRYLFGREEEENNGKRLDALWERWARNLVERRFTGSPALESSEWKAIFDLGPHLDEQFPAFVDLIKDREQKMSFQHGPEFIYRLSAEDSEQSRYQHLWKYPNPLAHYLLRAMAEEIPRYYSSEVSKIIRKLKALERIDDDLLRQLRDRYVEMGGSADDLWED